MEDNDAQLQLKKRARRRLVGAAFFVSVVAVVLPMVMDHEPRQVVQDVEIRIPGQDEKPFAPKFAAAPVEKPAEKAAEKPADKPPVKPAEKAAEKTTEKPKADEAKRAAAILAGQAADSKAIEARPTAKPGEYLVLIGAFANEANVKNIKAKLAEQGIKTFSEPLDTPQGKKTRVRAGPFPSRDAADRALEKMQRIGVSGVVAAKP